jgi:Undecaprenyl-phosphate glucose phosphotransferase
MLKQKRQLFEMLFIGADLAVVSCAWVLAYWARFFTEWVPVDKGIPPVTNYLAMLLFIWLIWAFVFKRMGLYRAMRGVRRSRELFLLVQANLAALFLFIAITYLFREKSAPFSRLVFVYFGAFAIALTAVERSLLRYFLREIRRRGYNVRYLLVVGAGNVASDVIARVRSQRELGIQILGCLSKDGTERRGPLNVPVLGKYADLRTVMDRTDIDQLIVALPWEDNHFMPEIMRASKDTMIDIKVVPDLYQFVSVGGAIEEFEGLPVISVQGSPLDSMNLLLKRAFDAVVSFLLIIALSPLMLLIALAVKATSRGPVLYRQERVSFDGSRFNIVKFRTMRTDAESDGPQWSRTGDDRVTPLGKFLRKYSLDELPQLFNVLRGDMSLVGPRPERPVFIEEFRKRVPRYMLRHKVPAGLTGWAQVNGWRGDTSIDKRIEFDLYYIEHWSLFLDIKILLLTALRGLRNENAY